MKRNLTKTERIRRREDIKQLFASSYYSSTRGCKLFYRENAEDITRILITPGRKYGNAVARNYSKRVGREIFRQMKERVHSGYDIAFIFYPGSFSYSDRVNQMTKLLRTSGILKTGSTPD